MTVYGYIRVSRDDQNTGRQEDALRDVVDELVIERGSAVKERPLFDDLMGNIEQGDTLAVLSLDRAFRNTLEALSCADDLNNLDAHFRILDLGIDTATPAGRLVLTMMAGLAEFERSQLIERTKQGLQAAKARGVTLGRPKSLSRQQVQHSMIQIGKFGKSVTEMAEILNVSRSTLHRALKREEDLRAIPYDLRKLASHITTWCVMRDVDLFDTVATVHAALKGIPPFEELDRHKFRDGLEVARDLHRSHDADDE